MDVGKQNPWIEDLQPLPSDRFDFSASMIVCTDNQRVRR